MIAAYTNGEAFVIGAFAAFITLAWFYRKNQ